MNQSREQFVADRIGWSRVKVVRLAIAYGMCGIRRGSLTLVGVSSKEVLGRVWAAKQSESATAAKGGE